MVNRATSSALRMNRHSQMIAVVLAAFSLFLRSLPSADGQPDSISLRPRALNARLSHLRWPSNVPESFKPHFLQAPPGDNEDGIPSGQDSFQFHWVITTCSTRVKWGRMLSSTLLSGILNGLQPASISLVYCKPYDPKSLPPILFNLQNSRYINLFFPPQLSQPKTKYHPYWQATATVLLVPTMLGSPNLPLLMSEDDIIFAPDAHLRIKQATEQAFRMSNGEPFFLNLYRRTAQKTTIFPTTKYLPQVVVDPSQPVRLRRRPTDGFQASVFTPDMTQLFLKRFTELLTADKVDPHDFGFSDYIVQNDVNNGFLSCNKPGSKCHAYVTEPSIVQHVGTASTTDPGVINRNFHLAQTFPAVVAFAGLDNDTLWR